MKQLIVEPRFRDKIPPSRPEEKERLERDILEAGEVYEPIYTWNDIIIDGHNRWEIIQRHPEIPFTIKEMNFPDEWAAIAWMCRKQCSRRNINDLTFAKLIHEEYEATCKSIGGNRGNQYTEDVPSDENHQMPKSQTPTRDAIAKEHNMSPYAVQKAVEFGRGLDAAEEVSPGIKQAVLSGEVKATKKEIAEIRKMPDEEKKEAVEALKRGDHKKPERKKRAENQGYSKALRETYDNIDSAATALYDAESEVNYTTDDLKEELEFIVQDFIKKAKRTLTIRSTVLNEPGAREKISAVLLEAETAVKEMKGLVL